jgi:predicted kinase
MNIIKTQLHTIIMLVGPTNSGKTTFAKNVLIPQLHNAFDVGNNFKPNIQYISSDDIRRQLLGDINIDKYNNIMTEVSEQAFELLFTQLNVFTTYPVNAHFVVVDTTGLSEEFRNKVIDISTKNNYFIDVITFDYKNVSEYKKQFVVTGKDSGSTDGRLISKHLTRLHNEVLKTIKREKYKNITRIKDKGFLQEILNDDGTVSLEPTIKIEVKNVEKYSKNVLSNAYDWMVIGDVHGCIDELHQLLVKIGFGVIDNELFDTEKSKNKGLIFVGDLVDKSNDDDLEKTIRFIHNSMDKFSDRFHMILGNHEDMVYKWITDDNSIEKTAERYRQKEIYYNTTFLLEKNEELKQLFFNIFSKMKPWVKVNGTKNKSFIVTHAPCETKYLEKMDKISTTKHFKCLSRSKNKNLTNDELTPYLMLEAVNNHPTHIFGHLGQNNVRTFKNKVCIDTGCVYGNELTGYSVTNNKPYIVSVGSMKKRPASNDFDNNLFSVVSKFENVNINSLDEFNQKRLNYIVSNGVGYISGTISPADKDVETKNLESLKSGLNYYKGKYDSLILEPKYMGSRAHIYLNRNIEKCYSTSRNGFKINRDLGNFYSDLLNEYTPLMDEFNADEMVLDGELMPWAAMGTGLIDNQFKVIDLVLKSELDFLKENDFDVAFQNLVDVWQDSNFENIKNTMSKKDLSEKFKHNYENFKNVKIEVDRFQPIETHLDAWSIYNSQVELYGAEGAVHFKPFRILKLKDKNGMDIDIGLDTVQQFTKINNDDFHIVDFTNENYQELADKWYENLTKNNKMEGCVIKPSTLTLLNNVAPYLKVRNPKYLTIIYGYDMYFPKKFEKLFNQKNINRKIKASIRDYKFGEQMLSVDISSPEFKQIVANFMFESEKDRDIDPRL